MKNIYIQKQYKIENFSDFKSFIEEFNFSTDIINESFIWHVTKEKHNFWQNLNSSFQKEYNDFKENGLL